jgi:hypothetical protein
MASIEAHSHGRSACPRTTPRGCRAVASPCGPQSYLSRPYELPQSKMADLWIKIAIVVEQRRAVFNAPGPDQKVDCLADSDPAPT